MVFNRNHIFINDLYNIKLNDSVLEKLEDASKKKESVLVTIDASHYGFLNKNYTIYRHDTVRDNIPSFVYPDTKPIIENHKPKTSARFGRVIAADYRETKYYNELINKGVKLEDLTTEDYLNLCKSTIIPMQNKNSKFNGVAYCQVVGKIDNNTGIKKILDSEFLHVSIGADPKRLICSECGTNQVDKVCDHYFNRGKNGIFMLAEELEYEELSFVPRPADKFGKVVFIHDGVESSFETESIDIDAEVDIILAKDFFKLADGKKIVCMDNICKVINEPEDKMAKKKEEQNILTVDYTVEFSAEQLKDIKLSDAEEEVSLDTLKISDEAAKELSNRDFAIVQKTEDGIKRRFPIHTAENVKFAVQLINKADDLTEPEKEKAFVSIGRAAKKNGIEFKMEDAEETSSTETETVTEPEETTVVETSKLDIVALCDSLKGIVEEVEFIEKEDGTVELKDADKTNPINEVFNMLVSFAGNMKWASESLNGRITDYLVSCGKEAHDKGMFDSLNDEVTSLKDSIAEKEEEIAILEDQNMELNYTMRSSIVNEIVSYKEDLAILDSDKEAEKSELMKLSYDALVKQKSDFSKLKSKLVKEDINNNKKEIKTITDPTLNDSDEAQDTTVESQLTDSVKDEKLDPKDVILAITNLFR